MKKLILCLLFIATAAMLAFPARTLSGALDGLLLWATRLVPSLFPFMVVSSLIAAYSDTGGSGLFSYCVFAGAISGFPVGACAAAELERQGKIGSRQSGAAAAFAGFCSPGFMIATVGAGLSGEPAVGLIVAISHYVSWLMLWVTVKAAGGLRFPKGAQSTGKETPVVFSDALKRAVQTGAANILAVGGYVVLFSVLIGLIQQFAFSNTPAVVRCLLAAFLELDNGASLICQSGLPAPAGIALLGFGVTWGGASVLMQIVGIAGHGKLIAAVHFCRGILAAFVGWTAGCIYYGQVFGGVGLGLAGGSLLLLAGIYCLRNRLFKWRMEPKRLRA